MSENTRSVSTTPGTGVSGASIQGQVETAVVTVLRDGRDPEEWPKEGV